MGFTSSRTLILVPALFLLCTVPAGCSKVEKKPDRVWTMSELQNLRGKTKDEVREALGPPGGLMTYDSKGRWHYPNMLLSSEGAGEPKRVSLLVYFSEVGEQRVTMVNLFNPAEGKSRSLEMP